MSPVYYANSKYAPGLREYIEGKGFDAVVSTHLFPMEALTAIRKKGGFNIPCYGVLTDYTCIPFFGETKLDGYFIPHEELRDPQNLRVNDKVKSELCHQAEHIADILIIQDRKSTRLNSSH